MNTRKRPVDSLKQSSFLAVRFEDVTYQIGKRVILDHINLTMRGGDITGILGPNGDGKTTLLSSMMGLRQPSGGAITLFNEPLSRHSRALRQRIGVVFQETALYDELTTFENLHFATSLYHVPHARQRIEEVLALLSLADRANDGVRSLSGGLRRRVAIARALLHSPDLLIIDEPTLGVDVEARHAIWSHLRYLKSSGTTIIVATNYLDEALALCDTVAVLRAGKLLLSEKPQALVARAGSCLDVECSPTAAEAITHALTDNHDILRIEQTATGLTIFLNQNSISDEVMRRILQISTVIGFRIRSADLAEIFRTLEGQSA